MGGAPVPLPFTVARSRVSRLMRLLRPRIQLRRRRRRDRPRDQDLALLPRHARRGDRRALQPGAERRGDAGHAARQQREGPEQRLDLRGRRAGGRRVLRPELRVHQRHQPAEPRLPEGPNTGRRWCAGAPPSAPTPPSSAGSPWASTASSAPARWCASDVPAFALMVGVPARRVGWMCQCGVRLPAARTGPAHAPPAAPTYRESGGRLRQIDPPGRARLSSTAAVESCAHSPTRLSR